MDFPNAPIAILDVDELSGPEESECLDKPYEGVLKRSLSDPFEISNGLQLEASLERLIWTFDENVSHGLHDSPELNAKRDAESHAKTESTLSAIKSFWRISVAPIENPSKSYPLPNRPLMFENEDFHMADAESVSEADFEAFAPHIDLLIDRQKAITESNSATVVEADGRMATHSADQFSSSSCESLSSLPSKSPPRKWQPTESVEAPEDDRALEASLRWAELQAALEAFKARHPAPLQNVTASTQDLETFSRELLCHYTNELEAQINAVSEQLVASLAEREELRLFREALDDFIILHNAVQLRRRQAAEAVLANATRFTSVYLKQQQPTMYRRTAHSYAAGSLIELADFSGKKSTPLSGSAVSLNLHSQEGNRMPRGHHLGDPIEFPGLRSALSRLSGLRFGQPAGLRIADDEVKFAARVVADVDKCRSQVTDSRVTKRLATVVRERGSKLPSLSLPWPMGRPECSQTLKLRIPIPSSDLTNWFSPRICKMNQVLLSALQESPTLNKLLNELIQFDPKAEAERFQLASKFLSASGFDSTRASSLSYLYASCDTVGSAASAGGSGHDAKEAAPKKTVTFNWQGTKEPFKALAAERNGDVSHHLPPPHNFHVRAD